MAERGLAEALILEDDALLSPDLVEFIKPGILPRLGADLVKLETYRQRVLLGTRSSKVGKVALRELASSHMGSAAYLISGDAARLAAAHPAVNDMGIDRFLFGRGGPHLLHSRILQADPSPVVQLLLKDHQNAGWQVWYDATGTAGSDIARTRDPLAFRGKSRTPRKLDEVLALQLRHGSNILRLLLRDPQVVGRHRRRIPAVADRSISPIAETSPASLPPSDVIRA